MDTSDRAALIRLASSLPKGSAERRSILAGLSKVAGKSVFPLPDIAKGESLVSANTIMRAVMRAGFKKDYVAGLDFTNVQFDAVEKSIMAPGEGVTVIWRVFPQGSYGDRTSDYVWGTVTVTLRSTPAGIHAVAHLTVKD